MSITSKSICTALVLSMGLFSAVAAPGRVQYKIVTASERGTYIEIGRDLAKFVADPAGIDLEVLPSKGSAENIRRMRYESGVKLALVQSDVDQAFLDEAKAGNAEAGEMIRPLRLVMPLYDEEIHFIVRADSPLKYIHEIRDKRLGVGAMGSGTALTSATLYRLMFGEAIPEADRQHLSPEDALYKLTVEKSIDVAVVIAGQPAKIFSEMKPQARRFIKVLGVRTRRRSSKSARATSAYFPATLRAASYPAWLAADVPTLAVKAFLVTYDYGQQATAQNLARFADALCANFDKLQSQGHPKWKQVRLGLPALGQGWRYYAPVETRLRACLAGSKASARPERTDQPSGRRACTEQEVVLLLCRN